MSSLLTYSESGVDIEAGNKFVNIIKKIAKNDGIGGFSGVYEYGDAKLVASTDGVGSKLKLCKVMNKYDTIGIDLVAMSVNDIICQGASPLFFLDYYSTGKLDLEKAAKIIEGIQNGCEQASCLLLGGETSEMPSVYGKDDFDLAGFAVGAIEKETYPKAIEEGDVIYGLKSSGLHSNGYTLVNRLLEENEYENMDELLIPTKIYVKEISEIKEKYGDKVKGFSHITGGGIIDNIPRILKPGLTFSSDKWEIPDIFRWIYEKSDMTPEDMLKTYNCGIGMAVVFDKNVGEIPDMIFLGNVIEGTEPITRDLF
tara:strand:+ start:2495 stop:3430 length:936 start_codon:yes stop_codon:yes gene_type:complete